MHKDGEHEAEDAPFSAKISIWFTLCDRLPPLKALTSRSPYCFLTCQPDAHHQFGIDYAALCQFKAEADFLSCSKSPYSQSSLSYTRSHKLLHRMHPSPNLLSRLLPLSDKHMKAHSLGRPHAVQLPYALYFFLVLQL